MVGVLSFVIEGTSHAPMFDKERDEPLVLPPDLVVDIQNGLLPEDLYQGYYKTIKSDHTQFYIDYAEILGATVDKRFPEAARLRPLLRKSFESLTAAQGASGGSFWGRWSVESVGYVEYLLYQGFDKNFQTCDYTQVSILDIRMRFVREFRKMERGCDSAEEWERFRDAFQASMKQSLDALELAELSMTESQQQHFRRELIDHFVVFDGEE